MNKGLLSFVVFGVFLSGCSPLPNSTVIHNDTHLSYDQGLKPMTMTNQETLDRIDAIVSKANFEIGQAERYLLTLRETLDTHKELYTAFVLLHKLVDSGDVSLEELSKRGERLRELKRRWIDNWPTMIVRESSQLEKETDELGASFSKLRPFLASPDLLSDPVLRSKVESLRQAITQQEKAIKQVRDPSIEAVFEKVERFIQDSSEHLRLVEEALAQNDFELGFIRREEFSDKYYEMRTLLNRSMGQLTPSQGNVSFLLGKGAKLNVSINTLPDLLDKAYHNQFRELSYLKESSLSAEKLGRDYHRLMDKAFELLGEADKKLNNNEVAPTYGLSLKSYRFEGRAKYFSDAFKHRFGDKSSELVAIEDRDSRYLQRYNEVHERRETIREERMSITDHSPLLNTIAERLKNARKVFERVDEEVFRLLDVAQGRPTDFPLHPFKTFSQAVKVSLEGKITPYQQGDSLAEGDKIGYTYTSLGQLPSTDSGESFNGLGGRQRRAFSSSIRVLNTQGLEVGSSFTRRVAVKGLKDKAQSGEFDCSLEGGFTSQDGLCFLQRGTGTGVITAFITRFSLGD